MTSSAERAFPAVSLYSPPAHNLAPRRGTKRREIHALQRAPASSAILAREAPGLAGLVASALSRSAAALRWLSPQLVEQGLVHARLHGAARGWAMSNAVPFVYAA